MGLVTGAPPHLSFQLLTLSFNVSLVTLAFLLFNALKQILFKRNNEPPVVFHWFPFIGNAVTYGQDPPQFLKECQAKVCEDGRCDPLYHGRNPD